MTGVQTCALPILEVNSKNTNAIALYHKYGFKEVAIRSGYYSGTDGILMEKEMI